ncbi:MAG: OmpH family outer membrane protein [Candidatus Symbiothrix sp.]|jgi:outer membrane protein|nr:OmpH family outer membrane protein [Candidatus Symbiothrix sp.]
MLKKIVFFAFLFISAGAIAQEIKIAYLNSSEVITAMPEFLQMQDTLQKTKDAIDAELKILEDEYNKKYTAFMAESETLVESIRIRRLQEIQDIEQRAQTFNQQSQQTLQQLQQNLFVPIQQKVKDTIEAVGAENNFTYVVDAATLLYISPQSIDATPLVKKKLGLN